MTVADELERAVQLSSGNLNNGLPPIAPPGTSSLCGPPPNPAETSGPSLSPECIGPLQLSPAFTSQSCSNSLAKVKVEALEVEEARGHQEDAGMGTGHFSNWFQIRIINHIWHFPGGIRSMVEEKKCWVQLERVEVVLKNTEQIQMRPGNMEETRSKKTGTPGEFGPKKAKQDPTESRSMDKVKCDECGKYLSKACLMHHKRTVHRGEKPSKCWVEGCGIGFANSRALADHKRVNHGYPKLKCKVEGCGSEFLFQHASEAHSRTHESKSACDECGKRMSRHHLSTHKKLVHRGEKPHACKVAGCTERFSRAEGLADHGRIAHGHPKLKCNVGDCGSEFSGYYDLRSHLRTHSRSSVEKE